MHEYTSNITLCKYCIIEFTLKVYNYRAGIVDLKYGLSRKEVYLHVIVLLVFHVCECHGVG